MAGPTGSTARTTGAPSAPAARGTLMDRAERGLARLLAFAARSFWHRSLVILAAALLATLPGLVSLPVTDRDEGRFAQASKQMLETGEFVDIRFQDEPRWKKPAGIYWLQAGAATAAGGPEAAGIWAYRLPSLLGVVGAALLLPWALAPLVGARTATLAALMLGTTLLAMTEANIAKTDAMMLLTAVVAFGGLARLLPAEERPGLGAALGVWVALAGAVLLKGPIVPTILALALLGLWALRRRRPPLGRLRPLIGLPLLALLVAPWLVAIWVISDGAFFAESVGRDLLGKLAEGQEKHWGPPGLYLLLVWLTLWPWAALIPGAARWAWEKRRSALLTAAVAWVLPFWIVLEATPTKLPHYVLPLYPAMIAVLAASAFAADRPAPTRRAAWLGALLVAVPGCAVAIALVALPAFMEARIVPLAVLAAGIGATASVVAARAALADRPRAQIGASLVASLAIVGGTLQAGLPALASVFASPRIAAIAEPWRACASGPLITAGYREPSLVFLAGTDTHLATPAEAALALDTDPGALVLLEDRWRPLLMQHWLAEPRLIERGRLIYFNYNRGKLESAALVTPDDPRWEACAP